MIMIILSNFQLEFFWASSNLTMNEEELGYNDTTTSINESYYKEEYSDTPCNIYLTEVEYNGSGKKKMDRVRAHYYQTCSSICI